MTEEHPSDQENDAEKGGLEHAPTSPTDEDSGTGSADKRSSGSQAEDDAPPSGSPGAAGGDITR